MRAPAADPFWYLHMHELFWLLLPVAALSGWGAARIHFTRKTSANTPTYHPSYLQGLNYLVNEEPDKALDAFIQALEVDTDTVETHLALGGLFRRRGEIDRAIRIHENLIDQPRLTPEQLSAAHRELARDYMRAGLLDRAEQLLTAIVKSSPQHVKELEHLLEIYQQEKEWEKALEIANQLDEADGQNTRVLCAQFCCELAENSIEAGDVEAATDLIKQAEQYDSDCVRASVLTGDLAQSAGDYTAAISAYERIAAQDMAYVPAVLGVLHECYLHLGKLSSMRSFLERVLQAGAVPSVTLALVDVIRETESTPLAEQVLIDHLAEYPTLDGIGKLMELDRDASPDRKTGLNNVLQKAVSALSGLGASYRCKRCGYEAQKLYWCCPGCKSWGLVKPVEEIQTLSKHS